jgi:hypothetical protein
MNARPFGFASPWLWWAVAMTALKLWLTSAQPVYALGWAGHDDQLFLRLAEQIKEGAWLGPYDQMTLAKGPFYPLWAAAAATIGLPLFLSQHLLYALAGALVVRAIRPALPSAAWAFAVYALLLWNPMSFEASSLGRVLRQHVYVPLGLLIFAGLAALYYRRSETWRRQLPWAGLAGVAFGAFHLTREETPWILPGMALLAAAVMIAAVREARAHARRSATMLVVALATAALPVVIVSALNARHYGWFGTVEFRASAFKDAYGALTRIEIGPRYPSTPVSREAREAAYAVSPAFATLRPHLEGAIGLGWADASRDVTGRPPEEREIGGGWLMWALRDAVAAAGHTEDAAEALGFYRRMADELNAACDDGRLPAGPRRSGFVPRLHDGQAVEVARTFLAFGEYVTHFRGFSAYTPPSEGDPDQLRLFREMTGGHLSAANAGEDTLTAWQRARVELLQRIGKGLRHAWYGLFWAAMVVVVVRVIGAVRRRTWSFPLTLAAAAWGSAAAYVGIQAIIHVTSFPVMVISSFASAYPFVLLFIGAVALDAGPVWLPRARTWMATRIPTSWVQPGPELPSEPDAPWRRRLPWVGAPLALLPYLANREAFDTLFWFADDLFLVDQLAQMGFSKWVFAFFTESFVPVFKALWGGMLFVFDGSYPAMIRVLWLTHAFNTVLLGRLLARAGFAWSAVLFVQTVFALAPANLESLSWSVQWSALLAVTCLLCGLVWFEGRATSTAGWSTRGHGPLVVLAAVGAACFARGVLTGGVFAFAVLLVVVTRRAWAGWRRWLVPVVACVLPSCAVAAGILLFAHGNQQSMDGHWGDAFQFGTTYLAYNAGYLLLGEPAVHGVPYHLLALVKLGLVAGGFALAGGRARALLLVLLAYDLGNAVLLGIGRHHTGLYGALGQRYAYSALIGTLPFAGVLLARGLDGLAKNTALRRGLAALLLAGLGWHLLRGWPQPLAPFVAWRGTEMRALMAAPYTTDPAETVPALDFMHMERAKALQRTYELH